MKKILILLILICFTLISSCRVIMGIDDYIKKVELGMTRQEVIKIVGNDYTRSASFINDDGQKVDILRFCYYGANSAYMLTFEDDKLVDIHQDIPYYHSPLIQSMPAE